MKISSDQEFLGCGIDLILLNVGTYFVCPGIMMMMLRK